MNFVTMQSEDILSKATTQRSSDIHFCPEGDSVHIYFRIDGYRTFSSTLTRQQYTPLLSYFKFTSGMDIGETLTPQDGKSQYVSGTNSYDLRLSTLPLEETESLAIRILPQKEDLPLESLFLFPSQTTQLRKWIGRHTGIILFTGPTGSGKTTTLYALLQTLLKEQSYQTITLEDPIEQRLHDILQVQVNEKAGMDYYAGLKAALRHDPDILMLGEIRDEKTAQFAFHAAHTGHLVLSTLHAKNAYGTIYRLLEMGISKTDLEQTLIAIASQQLLPIVCPKPHKQKRTAILEMLEGRELQEALAGHSPYKSPSYPSFANLRRKAYALGFIT
ncbi:competence type IV pilus ATPase ComGA [Pontibacillus sp. ALD_SL1]|uniref:competence type IV pilus ATPase ComGA n=1 Tax=Pontibacillus sp. ALD_SL1 TaxID=2777185 RepID=UPI001F61D2B5|nr:competence type IV pilus ATPase ComGA [Pontibacillus sp. ALD_SL1]